MSNKRRDARKGENERKGVLIGSKLILVFCARRRAENNGKWGKIELGWERKKGKEKHVRGKMGE